MVKTENVYGFECDHVQKEINPNIFISVYF